MLSIRGLTVASRYCRFAVSTRVHAVATLDLDLDFQQRNSKVGVVDSPTPYTVCRQHRRLMSTLYTAFGDGEKVPFLSRPDVDVEYIMQNIDRMKANVTARNMKFDFENLSQVWKRVQELKVKVESLESEKQRMNRLAKEINIKKGSEEEKQKIRRQSKELRQELKEVNTIFSRASEDLFTIVLKLPNFTHADTPMGSEVIVVYSHGEKEAFQPWMRSHVEIGKQKDLLSLGHDNVHRGACYFKNEVTLLEQAVLSWISESLHKHGLLQMSCPDMFRDLIVVYSVIGSDGILYLKGSSIMSFAAYYTMMVLENDNLPDKCFSIGRNYNPKYETDNLTSLCVMQQSTMVHVCGLTRNSDIESDQVFQEFIEILRSLFSQLTIHFRMVNLPSCKLSPAMSRKSSLQIWLPSEKQYVEVASVEHYTDFISRRLKIQHPTSMREQAVKSRNRSYCQIVFGTAINVPAFIAAILEQYQQQDGSILIPPPLVEFMYNHPVIAES
ncbi:serine--tRNA ligase-like isoform X2 [Ptychodera flava]|uniref:serine--tRNA ligase-like isoform X2 n=1 Tax=Ptychodera flava TaxID=63121 RepID=UPI00396A6699